MLPKWEKPDGNRVKINFDGAYSDTCHRFASNAVARNEEGVLCVQSELHGDVFSPFCHRNNCMPKSNGISVRNGLGKHYSGMGLVDHSKKGNISTMDKSFIGAYIDNIQ